MDDDDDFDISEPIEGENNANNFQDLDDLEDDLFGSALKKKLTSKFTTGSSKSILSPKNKPVISDEFDEDDPLAGLLSDEDEDKPKTTTIRKKSSSSTPSKGGSAAGDTQKDSQSRKLDLILDKSKETKDKEVKNQENLHPKKKDVFDEDLDVLENLGLTETTQKKNVIEKKPQTPIKGNSFMKDLLGNKNEEKQEKPKLSEFKLDEKYKVKTQEKSDYLFGTYSPSAPAGGGTPRRRSSKVFDEKPLTANPTIGRSGDDDWLSSKKETSVSSQRKANSADWLVKDENPSASPGSGRRRQSDWLSKDSSKAISDKSDWLSFEGKKPVQTENKSISDIFSADPNKEKKSIVDTKDQVDFKQLETKKVESQSSVPVTMEEEKPPPPPTTQLNPVKEQTVTSDPQANIQSQATLQLQNEMIEQIGSLQSMVTKLQMEKEHLTQTLENTQKRHEEELKTAETYKREERKTMEEQFFLKEQRMKEDYEERLRKLERIIEELKIDKNEFTKTQKEKYEDIEINHRKEIQRLKELHDRAITAMKEEHEEALTRLKELKDQEVEAISSTQSYGRTIQNLAEQLEARTLELRELQYTVEGRHQDTLKERLLLIETKEKDLRSREQMMLRRREEEEEERVRLQQLVMRLESRLQLQTKETEENRWEYQQEKVKLEVQQKSLIAERRQLEEQLDLERNQLKRSKDSLLQEQQRLYTEIAQQRQQLVAERSQFESQMRKWQQQESERLATKLKEEINLNAERQFLQEEKKQLDLKRQQLEEALKELQLDRLSIERDVQKNKIEEETTNKLTLELHKRSKEIEEMYKSAILAREEGKIAYQKAQEMEIAANNQMSEFKAQLETIKMKEKQLLEQKLILEEQKNLLQNKKAFMFCPNCQLSMGSTFPAIYAATYFPNKQISGPPVVKRSEHDPNMLLWQISAQKDKEFLEVESSFLRSLNDQTGQNT